MGQKICLARAIRLRCVITIKELGRAAGVSPQLVSSIELEPSRWSVGHEKLLRRAFETVARQRQEQAARLLRELEEHPESLFTPVEEEPYGTK